jgi:hypothetical protein
VSPGVIDRRSALVALCELVDSVSLADCSLVIAHRRTALFARGGERQRCLMRRSRSDCAELVLSGRKHGRTHPTERATSTLSRNGRYDYVDIAALRVRVQARRFMSVFLDQPIAATI